MIYLIALKLKSTNILHTRETMVKLKCPRVPLQRKDSFTKTYKHLATESE